MGNEASKAALRRARHPRFAGRYFVGRGLDIGPGSDGIGRHRDKFPLMGEVDEWDIPQGDAQYLEGVPNETYDFIHSSHCLEHLNDPFHALLRWVDVLKPGGYLVITVPDEDLYEQGVWPSTFSGHATSWTIYKTNSWSPRSRNVFDAITHLWDCGRPVKVIAIGLHDEKYKYGVERFDQTGEAEVDLEFVLQKI